MELGIDLGTATTVVSDVRRGIVPDEPSVMLLRRGGSAGERVLAVGRDAAALLGRAPSEFDDLPPQGISDVLAEGVQVFGGGSLVRGFATIGRRAVSSRTSRVRTPAEAPEAPRAPADRRPVRRLRRAHPHAGVRGRP